MAAFSPMISIDTLYLNCLNTPAKTQRFAKRMYKKMNRRKQNQPKKYRQRKLTELYAAYKKISSTIIIWVG